MTLDAWRSGGREIAVVGLGASGEAASRLLHAEGLAVYASDLARDPALRPALEATAAALRALGVSVELGGHDLARIAAAGGVVVSPGVPPEAPPLAAARAAGVPVRAEADLGLECLAGVPWIGITGTNGKTTTTALVAHLLQAGGYRAVAAGNIGTPVTAVALEPIPPDWMAIELSSFQLHDCGPLHPRAGVLTNFSPDHLDRYARLEDYAADKARLFHGATDDAIWIVNADDAPGLGLLVDAAGRRRQVSLHGPADAWYDREAGWLRLGDAPLLRREAFPLLGDHNVANALMAALAAEVAGVDPGAMAAGLESFRALPHRLEPVGTVGGVLWINDSKATNVASTEVALAAMDRPYVLLLGGRHKGEPYTRLAPLLRQRCRAVVAYGEAGPLIRADLAAVVPVDAAGMDWDEVLAAARARAEPGDAILLSPACSSFDMFANYGERGTRFRAAAAGG